MGKVVAMVRIMPEDNNKINEILERMRAEFEVKDSKQEAIAFGLKALEIALIIEDKEGEIQKLEREIEKINGVKSFEILDVSLL